MAKPVVVVESEGKARTLEEQFGDEVEILLVRSLPVKVAHLPSGDRVRKGVPHFSFTAAAEAGGKEFLDAMQACQGRELYLAFDNDWRGELWAWAMGGYWAGLSAGAVQPGRLHLAGLSGPALQESFRLVAPVRPERGVAAHVRLLFDAGLGRHLQRLLGTRSGPGGVPLNHMSLATLFLLAERETEIRLYTPAPKWRLHVRLATSAGEWSVRLQEAYGITDDGFLRNEKEVREAVALFDRKPFEVVKVARTPFSVSPPAPYHLATLLHDCVVLCGLQPFAAIAAVRNLYHGVVVAGRRQGLVTSFLPLGNNVLDAVLAAVRRRTEARLGSALLGPEGAPEETSGMILPTMPELEPEALQGELAAAELQVYRLIWSRALASQMREAGGEALGVVLKAGDGCIFEGSGKVLEEKGFLALQQGCHDLDSAAVFSPQEMQEGRLLQCLRILPEKNAGNPPEYHTFESLAGELADFSLDMDGSGVALLQQLLDHDYLNLMPDGSFRCAGNAAKLIAVMNRALPSMQGVNLSAYLAQTMEEAVTGRKPMDFALQQFEQTMLMRGEVLVKIAVPSTIRKRGISSRSIIRPQGEGEVAPTAVSPPVPVVEPLPGQEKTGGEGGGVESVGQPPEKAPAEAVRSETLAAPDAEAGGGERVLAVAGDEETGEGEGAAAPVGEEMLPGAEDESAGTGEDIVSGLAEDTEEIFAEAPSSLEEVDRRGEGEAAEPPPVPGPAAPAVDEESRECPDCGRPLLLKEDRFGKYWACSGYPQCRHSEAYLPEGGPSAMLCPLCLVGTVVTKRTPTGKAFYVCPEQECEFMAWARPHAIPCQICGSPFLVESRSRSGKTVLRCPRAGCSYQRPLPDGLGGQGDEPAPARAVRKVLVRRVAGGPGSGGVRKVRVVRRKK